MAQIQHLLLDGVDGLLADANGGQHGATILFSHTNDQIATTQVVKIVGKGANGLDDIQWIPADLELQPLPFDRFAMQEIIDIDGEGVVGHCSFSFRLPQS